MEQYGSPRLHIATESTADNPPPRLNSPRAVIPSAFNVGWPYNLLLNLLYEKTILQSAYTEQLEQPLLCTEGPQEIHLQLALLFIAINFHGYQAHIKPVKTLI